MRWFGSSCLWLQHISKRTPCNSFEVILLLFSFPCFKISNFFFKICYMLNQRRALLLQPDNAPWISIIFPWNSICRSRKEAASRRPIMASAISLIDLRLLNAAAMALKSGIQIRSPVLACARQNSERKAECYAPLGSFHLTPRPTPSSILPCVVLNDRRIAPRELDFRTCQNR
jgi:hypothetical protein